MYMNHEQWGICDKGGWPSGRDVIASNYRRWNVFIELRGNFECGSVWQQTVQVFVSWLLSWYVYLIDSFTYFVSSLTAVVDHVTVISYSVCVVSMADCPLISYYVLQAWLRANQPAVSSTSVHRCLAITVVGSYGSIFLTECTRCDRLYSNSHNVRRRDVVDTA